MEDTNAQDIYDAFDILLDEIDEERVAINGVGSRAFEYGEYDEVSEVRRRAIRVTDLRDSVSALRSEWESLFASRESTVAPSASTNAHPPDSRSRRGQRTPEAAYRLPILQALQRHGGSASITVIVDEVGEAMADVLLPHDHLTLRSDPSLARWRNAVAWTRSSLVKDGYMRDDSRRGTWEISDQGLAYLRDVQAAEPSA